MAYTSWVTLSWSGVGVMYWNDNPPAITPYDGGVHWPQVIFTFFGGTVAPFFIFMIIWLANFYPEPAASLTLTGNDL